MESTVQTLALVLDLLKKGTKIGAATSNRPGEFCLAVKLIRTMAGGIDIVEQPNNMIFRER